MPGEIAGQGEVRREKPARFEFDAAQAFAGGVGQGARGRGHDQIVEIQPEQFGLPAQPAAAERPLQPRFVALSGLGQQHVGRVVRPEVERRRFEGVAKVGVDDQFVRRRCATAAS